MRQMKDSGVEWLGEIPADWALRQAGQLADQTKMPNEGMAETNLLSLSYGKVKRRDINATDGLLPDSFETYNIIEPDDIVLRFTDLQNDQKSLRVGRATERGIITSAYVTVRPFDPSCSRFMYYALHSYDLCKGFYGMGAGVRQGLKWQEARYILLPWPDKDEQTRIADFLDAKCAEIDRAVSAAEQSIQEYKAYKSSVIFQAVTKGLDPTAPMKDSGLEWIGSTPMHWDVLEQKWLMRKVKSICEKWQGESVLSLTTNGVIVRDIESGKGKFPASFDGYQYINDGNLVLCLFDIDVTPRCVGLAGQSGVISPAYSQFVMLGCASARFYDYYLRAMDDRKLYLGLTSTMRHSFTADVFGLIRALRPPMEEQIAIADFLDAKCSEIDRLVEAKQAIIDELKSYKQSLIYEAVTGKLEV
ncbi:restriction endonuclease subunit S [Paratractidigestivibacter sp.]|uniref:restriction endonuclease subunit S n=1 Tax=Paratractidigestivibacter sp. TaxID=2847316 RepID=UPI002ABD9F4C|nr:restriction endonuclease subunit S [Paratractidigestivibacter sp.]